MKELWKKFDEVELTHSSIHHLMAMHFLFVKNGYIRGVDIAGYLNISRSSVSITMKKLIAKGYVYEDENKFFHFSDKGKILIESVLNKRKIIQIFFNNVLKLDDAKAEEEACKIEHLLSKETGEKLLTFVGYYLSDSNNAENFRKELEKFTLNCNNTEDCSVCESNCYFSSSNQ
jgi:DtxR family Mn-dependent transcriptional regulator